MLQNIKKCVYVIGLLFWLSNNSLSTIASQAHAGRSGVALEPFEEFSLSTTSSLESEKNTSIVQIVLVSVSIFVIAIGFPIACLVDILLNAGAEPLPQEALEMRRYYVR